jgi:hypothetical protein
VVSLLRAARTPKTDVERHDDWHIFQGNQYWNNVLTSWDPQHEGIGSDFSTLVGRAYKGNAIVYACEMTRMALVSEARPQWRRIRNGRRGDLFGNQDLAVLERPWPGGTFRQLASRMMLNADMAGTAFVARRHERPDRLMLMRPDWVVMVLGSADDGDGAQFAMDADFLGCLYYPGGKGAGRDPIPLLSDEVAVWAPSPDPAAAYRGVSWLSAVGREIDSDVAATMHKAAFFERGATPQMVLSLDPAVKREQFNQFTDRLEDRHAGVANAYRTLVLQGRHPAHRRQGPAAARLQEHPGRRRDPYRRGVGCAPGRRRPVRGHGRVVAERRELPGRVPARRRPHPAPAVGLPVRRARADRARAQRRRALVRGEGDLLPAGGPQRRGGDRVHEGADHREPRP